MVNNKQCKQKQCDPHCWKIMQFMITFLHKTQALFVYLLCYMSLNPSWVELGVRNTSVNKLYLNQAYILSHFTFFFILLQYVYSPSIWNYSHTSSFLSVHFTLYQNNILSPVYDLNITYSVCKCTLSLWHSKLNKTLLTLKVLNFWTFT